MQKNNLKSLAIVACAALLCFGIAHKHNTDIASAKQQYQLESRHKTQALKIKLEDAFHQIYQGIRTIARLPGVKNISRHGENFEGDAKQTVQEIYNNLATNVSMSEVYIVPSDMEPDSKDPVTGELQSPIVTFDQLIVGKKAEEAESEDSSEPELEETEIYEYRLMKKQIAWFAAKYGKESDVDGLKFPALSGPEVITCDNSRYSAGNPNDKDRSGLVYSLPFYSSDGQFKGLVSAVILSRALQDYLSEPYYAIRIGEHDYTVYPDKTGEWEKHKDHIANENAADDLIYSELLALDVLDSEAKWSFWVGQPDSLFWSRADVVGIQRFTYGTYAVVVLLAALLLLALKVSNKNQMLLSRVVKRLTVAVSKTTSATEELAAVNSSLAGSCAQQASAVQEAVASMSEISGMIARTSENAQQSLEVVTTVKNKTDEGRLTMESMASSMEAIHEAHSKLDHMRDMVKDIASKTSIINDIVFKTQLLAFNASIEAARAGQHGRGFAVVAEEVGNLAETSGAAAKEIEVLLQQSQNQMSDILEHTQIRLAEGKRVSLDAARIFNDIAAKVSLIAEQMTSVAEAAKEQQVGVEQTTLAAGEMDRATQKNGGLSSHATEIVSNLAEEVGDLSALADELRLVLNQAQSDSNRASNAQNKAKLAKQVEANRTSVGH